VFLPLFSPFLPLLRSSQSSSSSSILSSHNLRSIHVRF
jgi:hypothetical protein